VLAGGVLSGKYSLGESGRLSGPAGSAAIDAAGPAVEGLRSLAARCGTTPAALALAFALDRPVVGSVLFGATTAAQVEENARAVAAWEALGERQRAELAAIGR
jgi:aryl-alcohol dehydrogenase-like predicted oxidoreductase